MPDAARILELERDIAGADADVAAMSLVNLGLLREEEGDLNAADDMYRQAIATGHPGQAPRAAFELARLLEARGDTDEACSAYRYLLSAGMSEYAGPAVCGLRRLASPGGE